MSGPAWSLEPEQVRGTRPVRHDAEPPAVVAVCRWLDAIAVPGGSAPSRGKCALSAAAGVLAVTAIATGTPTASPGAGQCTGNFLFIDAARNVYLGQAAHCSGTGEATETNGCEAGSLPLGTKGDILGSGVTGKLAYNSWNAMQRVGEKDENACAYNDLALIRIPDSALGKANPSSPVFGGPTELNTTGTQPGDKVVSYGNSPIRRGTRGALAQGRHQPGRRRRGVVAHRLHLTPGVPGDSGSAFLDSEGRALGDLSTLSLAPQPLSNQVSALNPVARLRPGALGHQGPARGGRHRAVHPGRPPVVRPAPPS